MRKTQERILQYVNITNDIKVLTSKLGKEFQEQKVAMEVLTMARKSLIPKLKATMLLRDYPQLVKFLGKEFGSKLKAKPQQWVR